jgi:uncharacterized protein YyaL (SSP411 family)
LFTLLDRQNPKMNPTTGVAYFPEEDQEGVYSFIQTLDSVTVTFKVPGKLDLNYFYIFEN